jgi:hypothetical protein
MKPQWNIASVSNVKKSLLTSLYKREEFLPSFEKAGGEGFKNKLFRHI